MKKILTTFAFGPQAGFLDVSLPTFREYAAKHDYDLYVPSETNFAGTGRHHSWNKIPLILSLLERGYDAVLWLDADVAVLRHGIDIMRDAGESAIAMAVQNTPDGSVPSAGVLVARQHASDLLRVAWKRTFFARSAVWWEQAALISCLGGDPDAAHVSVPASPLWQELPYEWNPHINDPRGIPDDCRFFHATMHADRLSAMRSRIAGASSC